MQDERHGNVAFFSGIAAVLMATAPAAQAEPTHIFTLGEVEVSARAEEETAGLIADRVYAEEMRAFNADNLAQAVNLLPGVTASATGARNERTVYVRGFDIKHVPLFQDGIPIYVPYDGYPDLGRFTTFDLSEVVVAKGFTSVLYGPNTMGGAINLVSRRPATSLEGEVGAGFSSGDSYNAYANLGTRQDNWYLQGGFSYLDSKYFPLSDDFSPSTAENGDHRENSSHRDQKLNFKVGYTPKDEDEYAVSFIDQHGKKGTPPYAGSDPSVTVRYWKWPYWDKQSYYFTSKTGLPGGSYVKTRLYHDIFENSLNSYDDATYTTISKKYAFRSWYDDYTDGGSLELGTASLQDHLLKLALHYKRDVHRETTVPQPELTFKDQIFSAGLEDTVTLSDTFSLVAGIGYDYLDTLQAENLTAAGAIEDFAEKDAAGINPQAGLFYRPAISETYHVSVARKTRLPSIKDRYSYRLGTALPNPDLDPEKSINYEIGGETTRIEALRLKGTLFYNDVSDYIQLTKIDNPEDPGTSINRNENIGEVDLSGVEMEAAVHLPNRFELGANYTYTHTDNKSDDSRLIDIPQHKIFAYSRCPLLARLTAQVDGEYDSKRYSSSDGVRVAGAFFVAGVKLAYDFGHGLLAEAGVDNIFDEDYEVEEGYPEPGRSLFANLRYTF